ncbi:hypothetical protein JCGZ_05230 [Jatropha curcas]|uniref:Uncharacterized protein n=1 Tax=Jatropha curcas TaxID=180498 RepID=A0A067KZU2_JATCU|nr:hypothetical protein JCGZ_05230 [Jatropha curcas]
MQAAQVYYVPYPSFKRDRCDWMAVCKIKARSVVHAIETKQSSSLAVSEAFQEVRVETQPMQVVEDLTDRLDDESRSYVEIGASDDEEEEDQIIMGTSEDEYEEEEADEEEEEADDIEDT